jgi:hypothetical protein
MNWHTTIARPNELNDLLDTIRRIGGIITSSRPCAAGYSVTYVVVD